MNEKEKYLVDNTKRIYEETALTLFEGVNKLDIESKEKLNLIVAISSLINKKVKDTTKKAIGKDMKLRDDGGWEII